MIEFKNVTKKYNSVQHNKTITALSDINLTIDDGEVVFFVGSSGAGKSTMIRLLTRVETVSSGTLIVNGYNLKKLRGRKIAEYRSQLGIEFQDFKLFEKYTVYENVAFAMRVLGKSNPQIKRTVPMVLSMLKISERSDHFPEEMSGGEKQRAALARAIVNNPKILIVDEPTAELDPNMSRNVMDMLVSLGNGGKRTVIIVTHEQHLVDTYKNVRVVKFENGTIVSDTGKITDAPVPADESNEEENADA